MPVPDSAQISACFEHALPSGHEHRTRVCWQLTRLSVITPVERACLFLQSHTQSPFAGCQKCRYTKAEESCKAYCTGLEAATSPSISRLSSQRLLTIHKNNMLLPHALLNMKCLKFTQHQLLCVYGNAPFAKAW